LRGMRASFPKVQNLYSQSKDDRKSEDRAACERFACDSKHHLNLEHS